MDKLKKVFRVETKAQIKELAKLYLDIGKAILLILVLEIIFDKEIAPKAKLLFGILGLTVSLYLFTIGLNLLKRIK